MEKECAVCGTTPTKPKRLIECGYAIPKDLKQKRGVAKEVPKEIVGKVGLFTCNACYNRIGRMHRAEKKKPLNANGKAQTKNKKKKKKKNKKNKNTSDGEDNPQEITVEDQGEILDELAGLVPLQKDGQPYKRATNDLLHTVSEKILQKYLRDNGYGCEQTPKDGDCLLHSLKPQLSKTRAMSVHDIRTAVTQHLGQHFARLKADDPNMFAHLAGSAEVAAWIAHHSQRGVFLDVAFLRVFADWADVTVFVAYASNSLEWAVTGEGAGQVMVGFVNNNHYIRVHALSPGEQKLRQCDILTSNSPIAHGMKALNYVACVLEEYERKSERCPMNQKKVADEYVENVQQSIKDVSSVCGGSEVTVLGQYKAGKSSTIDLLYCASCPQTDEEYRAQIKNDKARGIKPNDRVFTEDADWNSDDETLACAFEGDVKALGPCTHCNERITSHAEWRIGATEKDTCDDGDAKRHRKLLKFLTGKYGKSLKSSKSGWDDSEIFVGHNATGSTTSIRQSYRYYCIPRAVIYTPCEDEVKDMLYEELTRTSDEGNEDKNFEFEMDKYFALTGVESPNAAAYKGCGKHRKNHPHFGYKEASEITIKPEFEKYLGKKIVVEGFGRRLIDDRLFVKRKTAALLEKCRWLSCSVISFFPSALHTLDTGVRDTAGTNDNDALNTFETHMAAKEASSVALFASCKGFGNSTLEVLKPFIRNWMREIADVPASSNTFGGLRIVVTTVAELDFQITTFEELLSVARQTNLREWEAKCMKDIRKLLEEVQAEIRVDHAVVDECFAGIRAVAILPALYTHMRLMDPTKRSEFVAAITKKRKGGSSEDSDSDASPVVVERMPPYLNVDVNKEHLSFNELIEVTGVPKFIQLFTDLQMSKLSRNVEKVLARLRSLEDHAQNVLNFEANEAVRHFGQKNKKTQLTIYAQQITEKWEEKWIDLQRFENQQAQSLPEQPVWENGVQSTLESVEDEYHRWESDTFRKKKSLNIFKRGAKDDCVALKRLRELYCCRLVDTTAKVLGQVEEGWPRELYEKRARVLDQMADCMAQVLSEGIMLQTEKYRLSDDELAEFKTFVSERFAPLLKESTHGTNLLEELGPTLTGSVLSACSTACRPVFIELRTLNFNGKGLCRAKPINVKHVKPKINDIVLKVDPVRKMQDRLKVHRKKTINRLQPRGFVEKLLLQMEKGEFSKSSETTLLEFLMSQVHACIRLVEQYCSSLARIGTDGVGRFCEEFPGEEEALVEPPQPAGNDGKKRKRSPDTEEEQPPSKKPRAN